MKIKLDGTTEFESPNIERRSDGALTWNGLDFYGMAAILDDLWGGGSFDDDQWDEWFEMYGSPYRVAKSEHERLMERHAMWGLDAAPIVAAGNAE